MTSFWKYHHLKHYFEFFFFWICVFLLFFFLVFGKNKAVYCYAMFICFFKINLILTFRHKEQVFLTFCLINFS